MVYNNLMKGITYIIGVAAALAVVDVAVLGILKVANTITGPQFSAEASRSLSIIGIIAIACMVVYLILHAFTANTPNK